MTRSGTLARTARPRARLPAVINERYRVLRLLGEGGMGRVLLVEDGHRNNRRLALKTLLPETRDEIFKTGFREEFAQLSRLEHPHLARTYDFGQISATGEFFFTTEFIDGKDLLAATRGATTEEIYDLARQLLRALDFIHERGILHNDLKPANILVERRAGTSAASDDVHLLKLETLAAGTRGRAKIIDFGLISREHTAWDQVLGTLRYISPERILRKKADRRSDLYAFGVILYVLLARRPPFENPSVRGLLMMHLKEPPPPLTELRPDIPQAVSKVIERLLAKKPEDRYPDAGETLAALDGAVDAGGVAALGACTAVSPERAAAYLTAGSLVGRAEELAALRELYVGAQRGGTPAVVALTGPAGVGKTRVVRELKSAVQLSGGLYIEAGGAAVEGNLRPLAEAVVGALKTRGVRGVGELARRVLASDATENVGYVLERFIVNYSQRAPVLLFLDDMERASPAVARFAGELLQSLRTRSSGLRLCFVLAAHGMDDLVRVGLDPQECRSLALEPFDAARTQEFLEAAFGDDVPQTFSDGLARLAGGNPRLLLEMARRLVEVGRIRFERGRWRFPATLSGIEVPEGLHDVLKERLGALSEATREVLTWLAVAGHPLEEETLLSLVSFGPETARQALDELSRRCLAVTEESERGPEAGGPAGGRRFQPAYKGIEEVLLSGMTESELRWHHQRLAQAIEDTAADSRAVADLLAEHWRLAGNFEGCMRFAEDAAHLHRLRGDLHKAVEYRRDLARSLPDTAQARKIQSLVKLSELHEFLWDLDACRENLDAVLRLGRAMLKPLDRALILRRLATIELARLNPLEALRHLEEAERAAGATGGPLRLALRAAKAHALWLAGHREAGLELLAAVEGDLERWEPAGKREAALAAAAAHQAATFRQFTGGLEAARRLYEQNLRWAQAAENPQALAATYCSLGSILLEAGRFREGARMLLRAEGQAKELSDARTLARARQRMAEYLLAGGRMREALHLAETAIRDARTLASGRALAAALHTLARIWLCADHASDALRELRRAAKETETGADPLDSASIFCDLAVLLREAGFSVEATKQLEAARKLVRQYPIPRLEAELAVVESASEEPSHSASADAALERLWKLGYRLCLVPLAWSRIETAAKNRDPEALRTVLSYLDTIASYEDAPDLSVEIEAGRLFAALCEGSAGNVPASMARLGKSARERKKLRLMRRVEQLSTSLTG